MNNLGEMAHQPLIVEQMLLSTVEFLRADTANSPDRHQKLDDLKRKFGIPIAQPSTPWIPITEYLPPSSSSMYINRVVVWRSSTHSWYIGWYLDTLQEWRIEGSPSSWEDITHWMPINSPNPEETKTY